MRLAFLQKISTQSPGYELSFLRFFEYIDRIVGYDITQIGKFRNQCKNIKLRHMYLRLINRDFYTKERMLRFRMSLSDACERCGEVETYK